MRSPSLHPDQPCFTKRAGNAGAPILLALFVLAAIPAVSLAQGLDAAILLELTREDGRRSPVREPSASARSFRAAVTLARRLVRGAVPAAARPAAATTTRPVTERSQAIALQRSLPKDDWLRDSLLSLPPPTR